VRQREGEGEGECGSKLPLLRLPGEIRNQIYEYFLTQSTFIFISKDTPNPRFSKFSRYGLQESLRPDLALVFTCRKIHHEAALLAFS
jgi:hypothetical protein